MTIGSIKCMVVGGCHITGYPVERSLGFVEVAVKKTEYVIDEVNVISPIHLGHAGKVVLHCARTRPNTLVLQLGHFETTLRVRSNNVSHPKKGTTGDPSSNSAPPKALFRTRIQRLTWDAKNIIKLQIAVLLGKSHFDAKEVNCRLSAFCDEIAGLGLPRVILLSPLPCADRVTLRNRLKLLDHFRAQGERPGFVYLDVMSSLLAAAFGKDIYYDAIHLNHKGHALLGQLVGQAVMEQATNPACEDIYQ